MNLRDGLHELADNPEDPFEVRLEWLTDTLRSRAKKGKYFYNYQSTLSQLEKDYLINQGLKITVFENEKEPLDTYTKIEW